MKTRVFFDVEVFLDDVDQEAEHEAEAGEDQRGDQDVHQRIPPKRAKIIARIAAVIRAIGVPWNALGTGA
ncbi:MAG: hypothetical protein MZU97_09950 [Bacillus subtilis]|nr:hypothetical protein [Bacillus subtilis]